MTTIGQANDAKKLLQVLSLISILLPLSLSYCTAAETAKPAQSSSVETPRDAKQVFSSFKTALGAKHQVIGRYDRGCLSAARQLPSTGKTWQVMRLSRNRNWGHTSLIAYIRKLSRTAHKFDGWSGLLVGDMGQPVGGPMPSGHASHQIGLDVDLWFKAMPDKELTTAERENLSADIIVGEREVDMEKLIWSEALGKLLQRAASFPEVARIFVHPTIKKQLCISVKSDRSWLNKIRPWWKHNDHFHVRLNCPADSPLCVPQPVPFQDDGCGKELDEWFARFKLPPKAPILPVPPARPVFLSDMPPECQELVRISDGPG